MFRTAKRAKNFWQKSAKNDGKRRRQKNANWLSTKFIQSGGGLHLWSHSDFRRKKYTKSTATMRLSRSISRTSTPCFRRKIFQKSRNLRTTTRCTLRSLKSWFRFLQTLRRAIYSLCKWLNKTIRICRSSRNASKRPRSKKNLKSRLWETGSS